MTSVFTHAYGGREHGPEQPDPKCLLCLIVELEARAEKAELVLGEIKSIYEWQNAPSDTASSLATTYQWLIERGQPEGEENAIWLEHSAAHPATHRAWTRDARQAAMFPDRETAERYIDREVLSARAVEHGFADSYSEPKFVRQRTIKLNGPRKGPRPVPFQDGVSDA